MANPSRLEKIQITGNTNSGTATKVNVQEANGEVNTQTINTGFNKNIGLGGSDVVGANTLLNQYSTTPVDWTATAFNSGQVVFYGGKQWISKTATVAGDVPAVSSKWEEITFEALANKTVIVDATPTDGSNNAVSSNAVFDGLALKSNIDHTHVASQITDLSKASVGLGNVDNTSDLSKPLSTATINALATKFPTPTGLTTNYLPKWNGSGLGNSGFYEDATGFNINGGSKGITFDNPKIGAVVNSSGIVHKIDGVNKWSINVGAGDGSENYNIYSFDASKRLVSYKKNGNIEFIPDGSRALFNTTVDNGVDKVQVAGTISASPATTANQVVVKSQLDAVAARPYKVYTAVLTQQNTDAPFAVVLENTLGGTVVWTRNATGNYYGTLNSAFPIQNKIALFQGGTMWGTLPLEIIRVQYRDSNTIQIFTQQATDGALVDSSLNGTTIEIRVYN